MSSAPRSSTQEQAPWRGTAETACPFVALSSPVGLSCHRGFCSSSLTSPETLARTESEMSGSSSLRTTLFSACLLGAQLVRRREQVRAIARAVNTASSITIQGPRGAVRQGDSSRISHDCHGAVAPKVVRDGEGRGRR